MCMWLASLGGFPGAVRNHHHQHTRRRFPFDIPAGNWWLKSHRNPLPSRTQPGPGACCHWCLVPCGKSRSSHAASRRLMRSIEAIEKFVALSAAEHQPAGKMLNKGPRNLVCSSKIPLARARSLSFGCVCVCMNREVTK